MKLSKLFKKGFLKLYLIDLACFILSLSLVYILLNKVNEYITFIKQYNLEGIVGVEDVNTAELVNFLDVANSLSTKIVWLFIFVPIFLFIFYNVFQALSWSRIKNVNFKRYLVNFSILNLIFVGVTFLLVKSGIGITVDILIFILVYFLFLIYTKLEKNFLKESKKAFVIGFKNFYPLFLIYLSFIIVNLILIIIYTIFNGYRNIVFSVIFILVVIFVFVLFKIYLARVLEKFR